MTTTDSISSVLPKASVGMITYNQEKYIAQAIESVLMQQTTFPFELVIGEDCSPDGTRQIVRQYASARPGIIRLLLHEKNMGSRENGRAVLSACRGAYVAFLDGDDYWRSPHKLQQQVSFLETHPECGLVHSDFDRLTGDRVEEAVHARERVIPQGWVYESLLCNDFYVLTCTTMYRREVVKAFLASDWAKREYTMQDMLLILFTSRRAQIGYINESLAVYRRVPGSITNSGAAGHLSWVRSLYQARKDFIAEFGCSAKCLATVDERGRREIFLAAYAAGRADLCREQYDWFRSRKPEWCKDWKNRLRLLAVQFGPLFRIMRMRAAIRRRIALMRESKRPLNLAGGLKKGHKQ